MDRRGVAVRGLLVRHLVLPGGAAEGVGVYQLKEISRDTYVNIMAQCSPITGYQIGVLGRRITAEYRDS